MTIGEPSHPHGNGEHKHTNNCYGEYKSGRTYDYDKQIRKVKSTRPGEKFPMSIIRIKKEHETTVLHPTQKPVELIRYLIRTYTNPGGVGVSDRHGWTSPDRRTSARGTRRVCALGS